jgi:hypothetical protein
MFETKLSLEQRIARTEVQLKKAKDSRRRATIRTVKLESKLGRLVAKRVSESQLVTETAMNQPRTESALSEASAPPPSAKVQRPSARSRK